MTRRRLQAMVAVGAVAVLALSACGSADTGGNAAGKGGNFGQCEVSGEVGSVSLTPITADTLTVQTNLPSPGWWQGTSPEKVDGGYEYCMAANIAHRAGLSKLKVVNASFDALVAGQTKGFDLALAQIGVTADRAKVVDFSKPYFEANVAVLVKKGSGVTEANLATKKLGVALGTTTVDWVKDVLKPTTPAAVFQETDAMVTGVASGQIDAAMQDATALLGFAKASNGALEVIGTYKTREPSGAIYPKGSVNSAAFDKAIAAMKTDGTLDKLSATWLSPVLGADPAKLPVFKMP